MTAAEIIGLSVTLLVMLIGLIGSLFPVLPGPPLILVAAIIHRLVFGEASISNLVLIILIWLTVVALVFDFLASMFGTRKFGATWRGMIGAIIGGVAGLFFGLPGIIIGPFLGAMLFELLGDKEFKEAVHAGLGATVGLLLGIVGKFAIGVGMIIIFATNVIMRS
ncbi:MAG TPA: DUF456 domain-containing protein [Candidatus Binatia bacterium]|nr:DUF456 domain-containing protein [Candidatus Binatia bacterium]